MDRCKLPIYKCGMKSINKYVKFSLFIHITLLVIGDVLFIWSRPIELKNLLISVKLLYSKLHTESKKKIPCDYSELHNDSEGRNSLFWQFVWPISDDAH